MMPRSVTPGVNVLSLWDGTSIPVDTATDHCERFRWKFPVEARAGRDRQRDLDMPEDFAPDTLDARFRSVGHCRWEVLKGWEWLVTAVHATDPWAMIDVYNNERFISRIGGSTIAEPTGYQPLRPWRFREQLSFSFVYRPGPQRQDAVVIFRGIMLNRGASL